MRLFLVFLISLLFGSYCSAEEIILGRIISIDRDKGAVAMEVVDGPDDMRDDAGQKPKVIMLEQKALADDIRENTLVRVWGNVDKGTGRFSASKSYFTDSRGKGQGGNSGGEMGAGQHDATGVRQRIGRGSGAGGSHGSGFGGGSSHGSGSGGGSSGGSGGSDGGEGGGGGRGGQGGR